jgi:hypothetical protein
MQITFKGTTEKFVDWLRGNVRQDVWPKVPPDVELMSPTEDDAWLRYDAWLRSIPWFVNTYPFKPPLSLDLPVRLEIKARISRADPEEDGALLMKSDIHTIVLFEVCYPVPKGILIEASPSATSASFWHS